MKAGNSKKKHHLSMVRKRGGKERLDEREENKEKNQRKENKWAISSPVRWSSNSFKNE
jgi:hypothetical protein